MRDDEIAKEAWRREASHHAGHRNFRPHLRPVGANLMGLRGEEAFGLEFGLPIDLSKRLNGDGGKDLRLPLRNGNVYPVDCKTAIIPKELIVRVEECRPTTIYVLCQYWEEDDYATLLGWQWGMILMRSVPKTHRFDCLNYWCDRSELRSLSDLKSQV